MTWLVVLRYRFDLETSGEMNSPVNRRICLRTLSTASPCCFIVETIKQSLAPVTLVCVGVVPNIAAALKQGPSIVSNPRFVGMHGSIKVGYGSSNTRFREIKSFGRLCRGKTTKSIRMILLHG